MSHYCEKIRWVLARWQIPYREEAHFQGFHYIPSFLHGRTPFVPTLIDEKEVITDSSVIMAYLDESFCERESLYQDTQNAQIRELEELFNKTLGVEFASMTAPITLPREYGIRLPTHDELPHSMKNFARELAKCVAGQFALKMFREEKFR